MFDFSYKLQDFLNVLYLQPSCKTKEIGLHPILICEASLSTCLSVTRLVRVVTSFHFGQKLNNTDLHKTLYRI